MRRVMQATWNWQDTGAGAQAAARRRAGLRRQALVNAAVTAAVGLAFWRLLDHALLPRVLWAVAAAMALIGLLAPAYFRPVRRLGAATAHAVGVALTYLLLVPLFYLFFAPVGLVLRVLGKDPLHLRRKPEGVSLWLHRRPKGRGQNITDQFLREDRRDRATDRPAGSIPDAWRERTR